MLKSGVVAAGYCMSTGMQAGCAYDEKAEKVELERLCKIYDCSELH